MKNFLNKKNIFICLFFILLIGGFLRLYKLGDRPFVGDEFFDLNAIYGYSRTGEWKSWDFNKEGIGSYELVSEEINLLRNERSWIYRWQVAQIFRIFPVTETTARLVSVFWGIISIVLMYFFAKYFTKKPLIGLICAFLFAINITAIDLDRTLRMYSMFFPIFILFSWFLFLFFESRYLGRKKFIKKFNSLFDVNFIWLFPLLIVGYLSYHLQPLTINIVPAFIFYCLIQAIIKFYKKHSSINKYSIVLFLAVGTFIILYFLFPQTINSQLSGIKFFKSNFKYLTFIESNYSFWLLALLSSLFGIFYAYKKLEIKKEIIWIASCFVTILVMAIFFWNHGPFDRYIFFIRSFEITLVGLGIYCLVDFLKQKFPTQKYIFFISLFVLLLIIPNYFYFFQNNNLYLKPLPKEELNYRTVFEYIKENKGVQDVLITRNYRNYYWQGENMFVFDFGGEFNNKKLQEKDIKKIISDNPSGWVVVPERDEYFLKKSIQKFFENNLEIIFKNDSYGEGTIYRWQK